MKLTKIRKCRHCTYEVPKEIVIFKDIMVTLGNHIRRHHPELRKFEL